jgi:formyl-CoA transferase
VGIELALRAMISMCDFRRRAGRSPERAGPAGNNHPILIPTGVFKTRTATSTSRPPAVHLQALLRSKAPELTDERFSTDKARRTNRDVLNAEIDKRVATYGSASWWRS